MEKLRFESAPAGAVTALAPYVDQVLCALATIFDEPGFAEAFVTDESMLSDFMMGREDYPRLAEVLGVPLDPACADDRVIYRIAAKLKERALRAAC